MAKHEFSFDFFTNQKPYLIKNYLSTFLLFFMKIHHIRQNFQCQYKTNQKYRLPIHFHMDFFIFSLNYLSQIIEQSFVYSFSFFHQMLDNQVKYLNNFEENIAYSFENCSYQVRILNQQKIIRILYFYQMILVIINMKIFISFFFFYKLLSYFFCDY